MTVIAPACGAMWYLRTFSQRRSIVANSKTLAVQRKHRRRQHAAKERLQQHLAGKLEVEKLPRLAKAYLGRHLRVAKRA